jgi:predicted Zn-dependent peptidase
MVLACAGNFDWGRFCSVAAESCGSWQSRTVGRTVEDCRGSGKKERVEKANLVREHLCLMSASVSAQDPRRFAASLLGTIIGDDVGSRFFWELVDKALAETATLQFEAMDGTGAFGSYIQCSSENVAKVLDTVAGIFDGLARDGITKEELGAAKNKVLSALVIKNELPMGRLVDLGFNWIYIGQYRTIEQDVSAIKAVTVDEVHSLLEQFSPRNFTQLRLGPAGDS